MIISSSISVNSSKPKSIKSISTSSKSAASIESFLTVNIPFLSNKKLREPFVPKLPPYLLKIDLTEATVLLLLSVVASTNTAIPLEAYPSKVISARFAPSPPTPFLMALSIVSLGMLAPLAFWTANLKDGLVSTSPPPSLAAIVNSFITRVKTFALFLS